jgi:tetratricopeptide (TPR) repeat protein
MKLIVIFAAMSLLPLLGCTIAEDATDYSTNVIDPSSSKTVQDWFNKGNHFYNTGSYELAIKCFDKAIELDPSYETPLD